MEFNHARVSGTSSRRADSEARGTRIGFGFKGADVNIQWISVPDGATVRVLLKAFAAVTTESIRKASEISQNTYFDGFQHV
jgi:hypothetical protein